MAFGPLGVKDVTGIKSWMHPQYNMLIENEKGYIHLEQISYT